MTTAQHMLLHRLWQRGWRAGVFLLLLGSLFDHAGAFGNLGDDWKRFDRQRVHIDHVIDDQAFVSGTTTIRLLGVSADDERATSYTMQNLQGRDVTLRLDMPQTRDAAGELLAYVYLSPALHTAECWNVDLVRYGSGHADRLSNCSMMPSLIAAEAARNKAISRATRVGHRQ